MPGLPDWRDIFCTGSREGSIFIWRGRPLISENTWFIRSNLFPAEIKVPLNDIRDTCTIRTIIIQKLNSGGEEGSFCQRFDSSLPMRSRRRRSSLPQASGVSCAGSRPHWRTWRSIPSSTRSRQLNAPLSISKFFCLSSVSRATTICTGMALHSMSRHCWSISDLLRSA
ncbi:MAG: hypothetical protein A4E39_00667 [Methanoregulaceae archaeon PtaB.Bin152]|nr:MAG: hypothetical protein A4E39_00667 [Methanoregulaceae archaeon PtaB.Bin152]